MRIDSVVALGDSVTVGVGDRTVDGNDLGWAAHLAYSLGAATYLNLSRTGARARDVVAEQLDRADGDLATLLVGGNDVLRADFDPDRVADDVRRCCLALTARGSLVVVVLLHDPALVLPGGGGVFGRVISVRAHAVDRALHEALRDLIGVVVVDLRDEASTYDRTSWHIDRMHPSAVGHRNLARVVAHRLAVAHGVEVPYDVPPPPDVHTGLLAHAVWLVRNGVPWFAKRSVDLIPELVRVVVSERSRPSVPVG